MGAGARATCSSRHGRGQQAAAGSAGSGGARDGPTGCQGPCRRAGLAPQRGPAGSSRLLSLPLTWGDRCWGAQVARIRPLLGLAAAAESWGLRLSDAAAAACAALALAAAAAAATAAAEEATASLTPARGAGRCAFTQMRSPDDWGRGRNAGPAAAPTRDVSAWAALYLTPRVLSWSPRAHVKPLGAAHMLAEWQVPQPWCGSHHPLTRPRGPRGGAVPGPRARPAPPPPAGPPCSLPRSSATCLSCRTRCSASALMGHLTSSAATYSGMLQAFVQRVRVHGQRGAGRVGAQLSRVVGWAMCCPAGCTSSNGHGGGRRGRGAGAAAPPQRCRRPACSGWRRPSRSPYLVLAWSSRRSQLARSWTRMAVSRSRNLRAGGVRSPQQERPGGWGGGGGGGWGRLGPGTACKPAPGGVPASCLMQPCCCPPA